MHISGDPLRAVRLTTRLVWGLSLGLIGAIQMPGMVRADEIPVDLELVLAVDISRSIDQDEARLQRAGYAAALEDPEVLAAIRSGLLGRIAITYMEWAGAGTQRVLIPWTLVETSEQAATLARDIEQAPVNFAMWTSIGDAIDTAAALFDDNGFEGTRRVIDVSGDGPNNHGPKVAEARDRALAQGIIINGLPILNDRPSPGGYPSTRNLDLYYEDCVIGGPGAFLIVARGFEAFGRAIRAKLLLEISGLTPPAPFPPQAHERLVRTVQDEAYGAIRPDCDWGERQWRRYYGTQY